MQISQSLNRINNEARQLAKTPRFSVGAMLGALILGAVLGNAWENYHAVHGTQKYFVQKYCPAKVEKAVEKDRAKRPIMGWPF